jgi:cytoskeleton-associated protein 5
MRIRLRGILKVIGKIYPVSKLFNLLLKGLESKNSKTRSECLEELASLIQRNGQSVFIPSKSLPQIAAQVGDRDSAVRNSALHVISEAYLVLGEDFNKYIGKLSEKEKDMILERIKRLPKQPGSGGNVGISAPKKKLPIPSLSSPVIKTGAQKEFTLDFDKIDIFQRPLESTKLSSKAYSDSSLTLNLDNENEDNILNSQIDSLFSQLNNSNTEKSLALIRDLEKLIEENQNQLNSKNILNNINPLMTKFFNQLNPNVENTSRLYKHYITIISHLFTFKNFAGSISYEPLEVCVENILLHLVNPSLAENDATKNISRSLNMLMVKIIESCHPNFVFKYD